jgi:hypothetical protein
MDKEKLRWIFTGLIIGIPSSFFLLVILMALNKVNWMIEFFTVELFQDLFVAIVSLGVTVFLAGWQYRRSRRDKLLNTKAGTIEKAYSILYKEALPKIYIYLQEFQAFRDSGDLHDLQTIVHPIENIQIQLQSILNGPEDLISRYKLIHEAMKAIDQPTKFAFTQYFHKDQNHLCITDALNHYEVLAMHLENELMDKPLFEKEYAEVMGRHLIFVFPYIYFNTLAENVGAAETTPHGNILRVFGINPKDLKP